MLDSDIRNSKRYSYTNLAPHWRVMLGDPNRIVDGKKTQKNITDRVEDITDIDRSLDYPNLLEFRIGEATLQMNDEDRLFDPKFYNNIYRKINSAKPAGYRMPVEIYAGFADNRATAAGQDFVIREYLIFKGEIHKIDRNIKTKTVEIVCTDEPQDIRNELVKNFGIEKTISIQGYSGSSGGEYALPHDLVPLSEDSVSGVKSDGQSTMAPVKALRTEGVLDDTNFVVEDTQIQTESLPEGSIRSDDFIIGGQPSFNFKSPYRDKQIRFLIERILDHYGVSEKDIELPDKETEDSEEFFSSNGRVGYDFEHGDTGSDRFNNEPTEADFWRWTGLVTDVVVSSDGNRFMFLYSGKQNARTITRLVEYNMETDKYYVRFRTPFTNADPWWNELTQNLRMPFDSNEQTTYQTLNRNSEYWSIEASDDFNDFYVLITTASFTEENPFGTYDSAELRNRVKILKFTRSTGDFEDQYLVPSYFIQQNETAINVTPNKNVPPQLAQYYHLGFGGQTGRSDIGNNRLGSLPFSKRIILHDDNLYYLWANTTQFGVARKPKTANNNESQLVFSANRDTYKEGRGYNHAGCSFYIKDDTLYATVTHMDYKGMPPNSRYDIFSIDLTPSS